MKTLVLTLAVFLQLLECLLTRKELLSLTKVVWFPPLNADRRAAAQAQR